MLHRRKESYKLQTNDDGVWSLRHMEETKTDQKLYKKTNFLFSALSQPRFSKGQTSTGYWDNGSVWSCLSLFIINLKRGKFRGLIQGF